MSGVSEFQGGLRKEDTDEDLETRLLARQPWPSR